MLVGALAGGLATCLPGRARAIGPLSRFGIGELQLRGVSSPARPGATKRLLWEIEKSTSIDAERDTRRVALSSDKLHESPFVILSGDRAFAPLAAPDLDRLRRYVTAGGFIVIDSAEGRTGGGFETSVRRMVRDLLPRGRMEPLPSDHVIYRSFYLLDKPYGRVMIEPQLSAVVHDQRAAIVYSPNDMMGAWARDEAGSWAFDCYPGGARQRELSFRMGVNLAMYALCLDYKTDQVHVPFILKRRQWKTP